MVEHPITVVHGHVAGHEQLTIPYGRQTPRLVVDDLNQYASALFPPRTHHTL